MIKICNCCQREFKDEYGAKTRCESCSMRAVYSPSKPGRKLKSVTERISGFPVIHKLKTWPEFYRSVANGDKPFELRPADRDFREGDYLCLQEFKQGGGYTGKKCWMLITYVFQGPWGGLSEGWSILGIRKTKEPSDIPILKALEAV